MKAKLLIASLLVSSCALAEEAAPTPQPPSRQAPPDTIQLAISPQDLAVVSEALAQMPYGRVVGTIERLNQALRLDAVRKHPSQLPTSSNAPPPPAKNEPEK